MTHLRPLIMYIYVSCICVYVCVYLSNIEVNILQSVLSLCLCLYVLSHQLYILDREQDRGENVKTVLTQRQPTCSTRTNQLDLGQRVTFLSVSDSTLITIPSSEIDPRRRLLFFSS